MKFKLGIILLYISRGVIILQNAELTLWVFISAVIGGIGSALVLIFDE